MRRRNTADNWFSELLELYPILNFEMDPSSYSKSQINPAITSIVSAVLRTQNTHTTCHYIIQDSLNNMTNNGQIYLWRTQMLLCMSHPNNIQTKLMADNSNRRTCFPLLTPAPYCYLIGSVVIKIQSTSCLLDTLPSNIQISNLILKTTKTFHAATCVIKKPFVLCHISFYVTNMVFHKQRMGDPGWCSKRRQSSEVSAVGIYCSVVECDASERRQWRISDRWHMSGSESVDQSVQDRPGVMGLWASWHKAEHALHWGRGQLVFKCVKQQTPWTFSTSHNLM